MHNSDLLIKRIFFNYGWLNNVIKNEYLLYLEYSIIVILFLSKFKSFNVIMENDSKK